MKSNNEKAAPRMKKHIIVLIVIAMTGSAALANYVDMVNALNPVSYWRVDETVGNIVNDEKGIQNGLYNNGVLLGQEGALSLRCNDNLAVHFDGGNDYADIPHNSAFELDLGTVQFWFKETGTILDYRALFSNDSEGFDNGGHLTIHTDPEDKLSVRLQSGSDHYRVQSSEAILLNEWYLMTFTFGAGGMQLYINDALVDDNAYDGGIANNSEPIALGASTVFSGDQTIEPLTSFWSGYMDEVVLYDSVLTQQQIKDLFDFATICIPEPVTVVLLGVGTMVLRIRKRR